MCIMEAFKLGRCALKKYRKNIEVTVYFYWWYVLLMFLYFPHTGHKTLAGGHVWLLRQRSGLRLRQLLHWGDLYTAHTLSSSPAIVWFLKTYHYLTINNLSTSPHLLCVFLIIYLYILLSKIMCKRCLKCILSWLYSAAFWCPPKTFIKCLVASSGLIRSLHWNETYQIKSYSKFWK